MTRIYINLNDWNQYDIKEYKYGIAVLKSLGYKTKRIFFAYLLKQLFFIITAYLTSIAIIYSIILVLNLITNIEPIFPFKYSIATFLLLIFINSISIILNIKKIEKIQPTILFQNI